MYRKKIQTLIASTLSLYGHSCTVEGLALWESALSDYNYDLIEFAFKKLIKTRVYSSMLVPAEICIICDEILESVKNEHAVLKQSIDIPQYSISGVGFDSKVVENQAYIDEEKRLYRLVYNKHVNDVKALDS